MVLNWLNQKRLQDYPRLIIYGSASIVLCNIFINRGCAPLAAFEEILSRLSISFFL